MRLFKLFFAIVFSFVFSTILAIGAALPLAATFTVVAFGYVVMSFATPLTNMAFFNFADLEWADGTSNMGGLQITGYYAPIADFDTIPLLYASPSTAAEEVTLDHTTTPFAFQTGKKFMKLYLTLETGKVFDEPQGELDGKSFVQNAEVFFPGTKAEALAFAAQVNNSRMLFIFVESNGQRRVIGSAAFPARCSVKVDTGSATADRKGMTMEIFSYGDTPAPIYEGDISLTPAS